MRTQRLCATLHRVQLKKRLRRWGKKNLDFSQKIIVVLNGVICRFANQAKRIVNEAKCNEVYSPEEAIMKQMKSEVARLKTELEVSAENEKKLRAEIATKEANFLSGKDMRVIKVDRRKTWHHMPGDNFQPLSLIPRGPTTKTMIK